MNIDTAPHAHQTPTTHRFPAATLIEDAAELIIDQQSSALPDLSPLTLYLPPRAIPAMRQALAQAAAKRGYPVLLLPVITTLADAAQSIPLPPGISIQTEIERELGIYKALRQQRWFTPSQTLTLSRELVRLCDELTNQMVNLPASLEEHAHFLARAYARIKPNTDFNFEAKLTYDIWRTLSMPDSQAESGQIDAAAAYALRLKPLAERAPTPLYIIGSQDYSRREQAFVAAYATRAPVVVIDPLPPAATPATAANACLLAAFCQAPGGGEAGEKSWPPQVLQPALQCFAARDVEDEATAALNTLKQWLINGHCQIAVVALDRQAARRLRALAERDGILMQEEIGWPYSTLPSATAVMRWLEALRDGYYHATFIDLIKSPFIFTDWEARWGRPRIKRAVLAIEKTIRESGVVAGLLAIKQALQQRQGLAVEVRRDAQALIERLEAADAAPSSVGPRQSISAWIETLQAGLKTLGITAGLARDAAGAALLAYLDNTRAEARASTIQLSRSEWIDWLRAEWEDARFRDIRVESPIVMTALDATRFRRFDGVILLGASDAHLPGKPPGGHIFNQSVRRALGLKTHADNLTVLSQDLYGLISRSPNTWISWQENALHEPQSPAPWVSALMLAARRLGLRELRVGRRAPIINGQPVQQLPLPSLGKGGADSGGWGDMSTAPLGKGEADRKGLGDTSTATLHAAPAVASGLTPAHPAPTLASHQVPTHITASGYQSLIDCPYQYFGRAVLKLREIDDVQEVMEKRDFGEHIHDILNRFHQRYPITSPHPPETLRAALLIETEAVFAAAQPQNHITHAWKLQWISIIDAYLDWQQESEAQGWRWQQGEAKGSVDIGLTQGRQLQLRGRIDRIDHLTQKEGQYRVIDYKARRKDDLKKQQETPGEDVQLPVYLALLPRVGLSAGDKNTDKNADENNGKNIGENNQASYLSLTRQGVAAVDAAPIGPHTVSQHLATLFNALHQGAPLRAQGVARVCGRCDMRGLCRRDHWPET
ncbi:MAG: PD-(D/E)XK nuclease family protein [Betaproteobacteria bacterium]|nr:PD-(D/E)XK nuclease family protein [Betaproteobacteria bacterium]